MDRFILLLLAIAGIVLLIVEESSFNWPIRPRWQELISGLLGIASVTIPLFGFMFELFQGGLLPGYMFFGWLAMLTSGVAVIDHLVWMAAIPKPGHQSGLSIMGTTGYLLTLVNTFIMGVVHIWVAFR